MTASVGIVGQSCGGCGRWGLGKSLVMVEAVHTQARSSQGPQRRACRFCLFCMPFDVELSPFAGFYWKEAHWRHAFCRFGKNLGGSQGGLRLCTVSLPVSLLLILLPCPLSSLFPPGSCTLPTLLSNKKCLSFASTENLREGSSPVP